MKIDEMAYEAALDKYVSLTGQNNTPSLRDAIQAYIDYPHKHPNTEWVIPENITHTSSSSTQHWGKSCIDTDEYREDQRRKNKELRDLVDNLPTKT